MQILYLQWKHGELSDREFFVKICTQLALDASMVGSAAIGHKDKNLAKVSDEMRDVATALHKYEAAKRKGANVTATA